MAQTSYSFANRRDGREPRNEFLGNVVLKVTDFDHDRNALTGVTRDGEVLSIRLADRREFADLYVNRQRFTTQDARERTASKQTGNRPTTRALAEKSSPGETAIQMQSVKRLGSGELVARWMESVTTTAEDSYVNAQVRVVVPRSNQETAGTVERRRLDVVLPDTATAATRDVLDEYTINRIVGHDDKRLDGEMRAAVLVAVQAADDPTETPTALAWTPWDGEAKAYRSGGRSLFERPLNSHNWEAMVPLAAQVGVAFEDLKFDGQRTTAAERTNARSLYEATLDGQIKVAVVAGYQAEAMPRLRDALVASEQEAHRSEGRTATMSDRGFFAADVGLRSREGQEGYGAQVSVKQVLPNEFLAPRASESYAPRTLEALGRKAIADVEERGVALTLGAKSAEPQAEPAAAPEPRPEAAARPTAALSASMS